MVERTNRLLVLIKLPEFEPASAANVMQAFSDKLLVIAAPMRQSMTYDHGRNGDAQGAQPPHGHRGVLL